jgi:hypothetical protein
VDEDEIDEDAEAEDEADDDAEDAVGPAASGRAVVRTPCEERCQGTQTRALRPFRGPIVGLLTGEARPR